jgi:hypothetical protein
MPLALRTSSRAAFLFLAVLVLQLLATTGVVAEETNNNNNNNNSESFMNLFFVLVVSVSVIFCPCYRAIRHWYSRRGWGIDNENANRSYGSHVVGVAGDVNNPRKLTANKVLRPAGNPCAKPERNTYRR